MDNNLSKTYDPKSFEDRIYKEWEEAGAFKPAEDEDKKSFTVIMPPPNITGQLHMGHALNQSLQDVLIRYKRMQGYAALWLPGTDHASIATEVKVADKLSEEEGKTKEDIGREAFLKRCWDWKKQYGERIETQIRKLGSSCDWERERFTMDDGCSKAVTEQFVNLYNKGLIYRGKRMINWCPVCGSALSDIEVEHVDKNGKYWYFRYPGADGSEGIVVATSRPETMFGDTAVAVNPKDERYKDLIGKKVILPIVGREIPIIADEYPDPEKGTGAVKITPAHDPNDFEVGQRHGLDIIVCIDEKARMINAGKYNGEDRYECRKNWVKELSEKGFLVKTENLTIPVGECYRCHNVVEPALSEQWFVKMKPLAEPAIKAVKEGALSFVPERFEKIYMHWMEEIRDWCISRQLWWGHRIPAYYCEDCGEMTVAKEKPKVCPKCGGRNLKQDEDALDTWFSSALWPFSTLGWPDETEDLKRFYPTDVLVTAYDIIFFWVARMVFSGMEVTEKPPFERVLIHGLVRDAEGRKMSKSLGNGIDPLEVIDKYGADALRFMLLSGIAPGSDIRYQDEKVEAARNFANKLWNASRFVIMNLKGEDGFLPETDIKEEDLKAEDRWMIFVIDAAIKEINVNMENLDFALAAQKIQSLIWNEFCDRYIELLKPRLRGTDEKDKAVARTLLKNTLIVMLKLLHPFMPFITEEIWGALPKEKSSPRFLMLETWPVPSGKHYEKDAKTLEEAKEIIREIRNIRAESGIAPSRKLKAVIAAAGSHKNIVKESERYIKILGNLSDLTILNEGSLPPEGAKSAALPGMEIYVPTEELTDFSAEFEKLSKEKERLEKAVTSLAARLSNKNFTSKAPQRVVESEKAKLENYKDLLSKTSARLSEVLGKIG